MLVVTFCRTQRKGIGVNNRTCHPALQVHVIIGGEAPKQVSYITNRLSPLLIVEWKKKTLLQNNHELKVECQTSLGWGSGCSWE